MADAPAAAKQKKWYDPTFSHGMTPEEVEVFLGSPDSNWLCRLGVLKEDGWPFVTPMWYQWRDGAFWVVGRKRSAWVQDLLRDPRCSVGRCSASAAPRWSRGRSSRRARSGSGLPMRWRAATPANRVARA